MRYLVLDGVDYQTPDNAGDTPLAYTEKYTGDSSIEALEPSVEQAIRDIQQFLQQAPFLGHAGLDQDDIRACHESDVALAKLKEQDRDPQNTPWGGWEAHSDEGSEEWDFSADEEGTSGNGNTEVEDKNADTP